MPSSPATRCHHVRTSGIRCRSLALRDHRYCYYHQRSRPAIVNFSNSSHNPLLMSLPLFEDAHAIQASLHRVVYRMLDGVIGQKTAGIILYALQIASSNLKHMKAEAPDPDQVVVDLPKMSELPPLEKLPEPVRMNSHTLRKTNFAYTPSEKDQYYDDVMRQERELRENPANLSDELLSFELPRNLAAADLKIEGDYALQTAEREQRASRAQYYARESARSKAADQEAAQRESSQTDPLNHKTADGKAGVKNLEDDQSAPGKLPPGTIQGCASRQRPMSRIRDLVNRPSAAASSQP